VLYLPRKSQGDDSTPSLNFEYKECKQHCINYEKTALMNTTDCQGSLSFSLEAKKACMKGVLMAFAHICFPSCLGEPDNFRNDDSGSSYNSCRVFWKKPNDELPWCRMGYDRTFVKVKDAMNKLRLDAGHRRQLMQQQSDLSSNMMGDEEQINQSISEDMLVGDVQEQQQDEIMKETLSQQNKQNQIDSKVLAASINVEPQQEEDTMTHSKSVPTPVVVEMVENIEDHAPLVVILKKEEEQKMDHENPYDQQEEEDNHAESTSSIELQVENLKSEEQVVMVAHFTPIHHSTNDGQQKYHNSITNEDIFSPRLVVHTIDEDNKNDEDIPAISYYNSSHSSNSSSSGAGGASNHLQTIEHNNKNTNEDNLSIAVAVQEQ
jgi:hypothetical protein